MDPCVYETLDEVIRFTLPYDFVYRSYQCVVYFCSLYHVVVTAC